MYVYVCVCVQTVPGRVRRAEVFVLVTPETPSATLPSHWDVKHYLVQANGNRVAGGPTRMGLLCFVFSKTACVCAVRDSSCPLEAQPTAAETWPSAHSWQLCQQLRLLQHHEASWGSPAQPQNQVLYHLHLKWKGCCAQDVLLCVLIFFLLAVWIFSIN